jgi:hypothetical protein
MKQEMKLKMKLKQRNPGKSRKFALQMILDGIALVLLLAAALGFIPKIPALIIAITAIFIAAMI